jgi:hypothetical protein
MGLGSWRAPGPRWIARGVFSEALGSFRHLVHLVGDGVAGPRCRPSVAPLRRRPVRLPNDGDARNAAPPRECWARWPNRSAPRLGAGGCGELRRQGTALGRSREGAIRPRAWVRAQRPHLFAHTQTKENRNSPGKQIVKSYAQLEDALHIAYAPARPAQPPGSPGVPPAGGSLRPRTRSLRCFWGWEHGSLAGQPRQGELA